MSIFLFVNKLLINSYMQGVLTSMFEACIFACMDTDLQRNIKKQLEQQNISVAELERRAGLRHAVMNIMHGRSKNPSIRVAQAIAKELGCSMEDLLSEGQVAQVVKPMSVPSTEQVTPWHPDLSRAVFEAVNQKVLDDIVRPKTIVSKEYRTYLRQELETTWMKKKEKVKERVCHLKRKNLKRRGKVPSSKTPVTYKGIKVSDQELQEIEQYIERNPKLQKWDFAIDFNNGG